MSRFRFDQLDKKAEKAMRQAVLKVAEEQKRRGRPLIVWKNGKVVRIPAAKIKLK